MNIREAIDLLKRNWQGTDRTSEAIQTLISLAEQVEKAGKELPGKKEIHIVGRANYTQRYRDVAEGFNSCLDQVTPILVKKELELAEAKEEITKLQAELKKREVSEEELKRIIMDTLVGQAIPCKDPRGMHPEELRDALTNFRNRIANAICTKLREGR